MLPFATRLARQQLSRRRTAFGSNSLLAQGFEAGFDDAHHNSCIMVLTGNELPCWPLPLRLRTVLVLTVPGDEHRAQLPTLVVKRLFVRSILRIPANVSGVVPSFHRLGARSGPSLFRMTSTGD